MSEVEEEEESESSPYNSTHKDSEKWFPFKSKPEMLLYVFMNSTSHPVVCWFLSALG